MGIYTVTDSVTFDIKELYSTVKEATKKIVITAGTVAIALYIGTNVCFASELVNNGEHGFLSEYESQIDVSQFKYRESEGQYYYEGINTIEEKQYNSLKQSLYKHKGVKMTSEEKESFDSFARQLSRLHFSDSLVRYSVVNHFVNVILAFDNGLELNVTQFVLSKEETVPFSIHHEGEILFVGCEKPALLVERILNVLSDVKSHC